MSKSKRRKIASLPKLASDQISRSGAITADQMAEYNAKRKSNTESRYNELLTIYLKQGMKESKAKKKATGVVMQSNLAEVLATNAPKPVKRTPKKVNPSVVVMGAKVVKADPWAIAKAKQLRDVANAKAAKRSAKKPGFFNPSCCIICKAVSLSESELNKHYRKKHKIIFGAPVTPAVIVPDCVLMEYSEEAEKQLDATTIPVMEEKKQESFSDKWLRLFSEKGYSVAMVEAFKRDANKQGWSLLDQADFLHVVKPGKKVLNENHSQAPVSPVEAPVSVSKASVAPTPVRAPVAPPVKPERGEKVEINTVGRDSQDQAKFRKAVSENYSHQCALTGDSVAVEACHIETHKDFYDNSIDNGIMLAVGLHRLFDKGFMVINPDDMTVHFTIDCFYKKHLEGAVVRQGKVAICKDKLKAKNCVA